MPTRIADSRLYQWAALHARCFLFHLKKTLPPVYGPRGQVMLGKGMISLCFGFAYVGVINISPQVGLTLVTGILPLPLWGVLWFLCGFLLISSAFRVDHSRALGFLTALLCLWALSYFHYFCSVPVLPTGKVNTAYIFGTLLLSMAVSTAGIGRMLNQGKTHGEIIEKPGALHE
jgi:hypothetical protein